MSDEVGAGASEELVEEAGCIDDSVAELSESIVSLLSEDFAREDARAPSVFFLVREELPEWVAGFVDCISSKPFKPMKYPRMNP